MDISQLFYMHIVNTIGTRKCRELEPWNYYSRNKFCTDVVLLYLFLYIQ